MRRQRQMCIIYREISDRVLARLMRISDYDPQLTVLCGDHLSADADPHWLIGSQNEEQRHSYDHWFQIMAHIGKYTTLQRSVTVSYTNLRAQETPDHALCRLLL